MLKDNDITTSRLIASMIHILMISCIYWSRRDNVMIALTQDEINNESKFDDYDSALKMMVQAGVAFSLFNFGCIMFLHERLSLSGVILEFLDIVGAFFSFLFLIDGYVSWSFHWQFWFCIMTPFFWNNLLIAQYILMCRFEVIGGFKGFIILSIRKFKETFQLDFDSS